jgi:hypothetical protein
MNVEPPSMLEGDNVLYVGLYSIHTLTVGSNMPEFCALFRTRPSGPGMCAFDGAVLRLLRTVRIQPGPLSTHRA